jgi:hypothetical protein
VIMKYTGIKYWLITCGLDASEESGLRPDTWREQIVAAIDQPDAGYLSLLDALVQEWSLQRAGESVTVGRSLAGLLHKARYGGPRSRHTVSLPATAAAAVTTKVIEPHGMTRSDVICEALSIGLDNQRRRDTGRDGRT